VPIGEDMDFTRLVRANSHHASNFFVSRHLIAYSYGGGRGR
jgi:hypothetical protein